MGIPGHAAVKLFPRVLYFLLFGLALIHGFVTAIRWWQSEALAQWEYGLLAIYPVLLYGCADKFSFIAPFTVPCGPVYKARLSLIGLSELPGPTLWAAAGFKGTLYLLKMGGITVQIHDLNVS